MKGPPRLSLRNRLILGTLLPLGLVAVVALVVLQVFTRALEERDAAALSEQRLVTARLLLTDVIDSETGMRGYRLSAQPEFLEPYARGTRDFEVNAALLRRLYAGDDAQLGRIDELAGVFADWRATVAEPVIAAVAAGNTETLNSVLPIGAGKQRTDRIRTLITEVQSAEQAASAARNAGLRAQTVGARRLLFAGTLAAITLGVVIAVLFARRTSQRVRAVAAAAASVAASDVPTRVPVSGDDELADLARSFNSMAARLERSFAAERASNEELRQRTSEVEQANRELESFSYSVSHDLRAPLRSIDGFSQALLEDYGPQLDGTARGYLARVRAATQRMGVLIDDLLRLSRLSREHLQPELVDLSALAGDVVAELRAAEPDRAVDVQIEPGIEVVGDRRLMRVALQNLLGNAWKFTRETPDARIELAREAGPEGPEIVVRDNGAGFDMRFADKLFGPFQRLHDSAQFEGTGIGLATVQRIIHRHGGTISASGEPGRGASFRFTLNAAEGGAAPAVGGSSVDG
jgi:signal transduction histidine kinase